MKILLLLDFDGVLYTSSYNKYLLENNKKDKDVYGYLFDPKCVSNLEKIDNTIEMDIVITSTWRSGGLKFLRDMFEYRGIGCNIKDITPIGTIDKLYFSRCDEVKDFLKEHKYEKIIIIDDNFGDCDCDCDIYKTNMNDGLNNEIIEKIMNDYE